MQAQRRSSTFVLSSLRDLKLAGVRGSHEAQPLAKRTASKKVVIRGDTLQDDKFYENIKKLERSKTKLDLQFIQSCLSKHFVFRELAEDSEIMADILGKFFCCEVAAGDYIMRQGDDASSFFVLQSGKFSVVINGEQRREILPGEGFGELALLYNAARSASLLALEKSTLWGIDRISFRKAVSEVCEKQFTENRAFINKVKFFEYLTNKQKDLVGNILIQHKYHNREKIVIQGDPASSFYIVKQGKATVIENGEKTGQLTAGNSFGEAALLSSSKLRESTVEADGDCTVLALGRDSLKGILGSSIHVIVYRNKIALSLARSPIFSQLDSLNLQRFIDSLQIEQIKGHPIVKAGQLCRERIFFILEGSLQKSSSSIEIQQDGEVFYGEKSILASGASQIFHVDMKFQTHGTVAYIDYLTLVKTLGGTFEQVINKQKNLSIAMTKHNENTKSFKSKAEQIKLEELSITKKLGSGQFGVVYLASHKGQFYALKCIEKSQIIECKLQRQLRDQKDVLELSNHPFILQYGRSFKDERFVYFLTQFINGLQLFDVIRQIGLLTSKDAKFYIASMILALQYLHQNDIIYRDLKPENIIVADNGYLKLIDMGTCKLMKSYGSRTFTIIGTPQYMAPEVLAAKGYSLSVDLWSLGVCFFEFICGYVPFGEEVEDPYEIYEDILNKELNFPNYITDANAKAIITQLLSKKQELRLGGSFSLLKSHPWFNGFEWDALLSDKMVPPYVIPHSKLTDIKEVLTKKGRTITSELEEAMPKRKLSRAIRKGFDEHWDAVF